MVKTACLDGPAFGGGVGLAFSCDFRLCTTQSTVTPSEAKLDPCPATFSRYVIRELGIAFVWVVMLTARPVTEAELKTRGFVSEAADSPE